MSETDNEMEDWTGEVGDRWLNNIDRFEGMLSLLHARLADTIAPQPGDSVLDIGCGGGPLSFMLAKRAGSVTGLDIAPQLIDLACKRADEAGRANCTFHVGDAQTSTAPGAPFDRIVSAFGVMFFEDSEAAFRNIHAMARPGAKLDFAAWAAPDRNLWMALVMGVMAGHVELPEPDPLAPGPFRFADQGSTCAMLERAGFSNVSVEAVEQAQPLGGPGASTDEAVDFVMAALDMDALLAEQGVDRGPVIADLKDALQPHASDDGVMLPGTALFYSATA